MVENSQDIRYYIIIGRFSMEYKTFDELLAKSKGSLAKRMAVAAAGDVHALEAVIAARKSGLAEPVLVGDKREIHVILDELGVSLSGCEIHDEPDAATACKLAVRLVREGNADFLMKGKVDTNVLMGAVVDKATGLNKGILMSHIAILQVPGYHKLLTVVDGGMIPYPDLDQKRQIIDNTVNTLLAIGYSRPKIGVLACIEKVNRKMPETVEADELAQMNIRGDIKNCIVNGPISYDCAMSREIAELKGYTGEVAGDVDILIAPNIHAGNIMVKMLTCTFGAKLAGIITGAACPIVLPSRGSSAEEKFLSIALSAAVSGN